MADWWTELDDHIVEVRCQPDGALVAAAVASGPVTLLDGETGRVERVLPGHRVGTSSVAWHPKGAILATAGQDGQTRLWDVGTGLGIATFSSGSAWVERLSWNPSGSALAVAAGRHITLLSERGAPVETWSNHLSTVTDIAWSPDGTSLAATSYGGVTLWVAGGPDGRRQLAWPGSSLAVAWRPDGRCLATGDQDSTVHFWVVEAGDHLQMSGYETKVRDLAWDASGRYLATGGGPELTVWDCRPPGPSGSRPIVVTGGDTAVTAITAHGGYFAFGCEAGCVAIARAGSSFAAGKAAVGDGVSALMFRDEGRRLLVGSETGTLMSLGVHEPS